MTTILLTTGDEPHVRRSLSVEHDPDARVVRLHDCIEEEDRGARHVTEIPDCDLDSVLALLASANFRDDPRQTWFAI